MVYVHYVVDIESIVLIMFHHKVVAIIRMCIFYSFQQFVSNPKLQFKKNHSQNGVKNKNLCEKCNNILGSKYDTELAKLRILALESFKVNNLVDKTIEVKKIILSIFGHFISSSPHDQKSTLDIVMTNYFWTNKNSIINK